MRKLALVLSALIVSASAARAAEIRTIGDRIEDDLVGVGTEGGRTVIKTARGKVIPIAEVKHIRFDDARAGILGATEKVVLLNQDEIHGTLGAWDKDKPDPLRPKTTALGELTPNIN